MIILMNDYLMIPILMILFDIPWLMIVQSKLYENVLPLSISCFSMTSEVK